VLADLGALADAGIGEAAAGEAAAGAGASEAAFASADVGVSEDLVVEVEDGLHSGTRQGALSNLFEKWTDGGRRIGRFSIDRSGIISAGGQNMAFLDQSGRIMAQGSQIGFIDADTVRVQEVLNDGTHRPIGILEGFVRSNGVEITSQADGTLVRVLRPNVAVDVIGFRQGQYLIRLAGGETFAIAPEAVAAIALLGLHQFVVAGCPDNDREGAVVRTSGEMVRFKRCEKRDGAYVLATDDGDAIVDAYDVKGVLSGDGIPGVRGDDARQKLIDDAQATASAVGTQPGEPAVQILGHGPAVPALEQVRYGMRAPSMFVAGGPYAPAPVAPPAFAEPRPQPQFNRPGPWGGERRGPAAFGNRSLYGRGPYGGGRPYGAPGYGQYRQQGGYGQYRQQGGYGQYRPPGGYGRPGFPGGFRQAPMGGRGGYGYPNMAPPHRGFGYRQGYGSRPYPMGRGGGQSYDRRGPR
jgi:hypothetical protein